mgnify:CR=1 FL=1
MGEVPYFPDLATKARTVIFWKMMYRRKLGAKLKMKHLRAWAKRIQYVGSVARSAYNKEHLLTKIKKRT